MIIDKLQKYYVINGDCGEWEERYEWKVSLSNEILCFINKKDAENYQKELQSHADDFNMGDDSALHKLSELDASYASHDDIQYSVQEMQIRVVSGV